MKKLSFVLALGLFVSFSGSASAAQDPRQIIGQMSNVAGALSEGLRTGGCLAAGGAAGAGVKKLIPGMFGGAVGALVGAGVTKACNAVAGVTK